MALSKNRSMFHSDFISKIKHVIDTAERGESDLGLGGCAHYSRTRIPYKEFKIFMENGYSIEQVEKWFPNGLIVVLENYDYFTIEKNDDWLSKLLVQRVGSNELLSCVIYIKNTDSGKTDMTELIEMVKSVPGWIPLSSKNKKMTHASSPTETSNSFWIGHYCIHVKGGKAEKTKIGTMYLANNIWDYASEYETENIELFLCYSALCSINPEKLLKDQTKIHDVKAWYKEQCDIRGILDSTKFGDSWPFDNHGNLICSILGLQITSDEFLETCENSENYIQYCHLKPKSDDMFVENNTIKTTFHLGNIAWGKRYANRWQGDSSVEWLRNEIKKIASHLQSP